MTEGAKDGGLKLSQLHLLVLLLGLGIGGPVGTVFGGMQGVGAVERAEKRIKDHVADRLGASEARIMGKLDAITQAVGRHAKRLDDHEARILELERRLPR